MILYCIKSAIAMALFLGIYHLSIRHTKSFVFARFFLLVGLLGGAITPFISLHILPVDQVIPPFTGDFFLLSDQLAITAPTADLIQQVSTIGLREIASWLFMAVSTLLALRFMYGLVLMIIAMCRPSAGQCNELTVRVLSDSRTPYSFFRTLFISQEMLEQGLPEVIIQHEGCHARQWHSVDRLLAQLVMIVHWWNPFAHFLRRAIWDNHEYLADDYALASTSNKNNYINELIQWSSHSYSGAALMLGFSHSSLKNRLTMITNRLPSLTTKTSIIVSTIALICLVACSDLEDYASSDYLKDDGTVVMDDSGKYPKELSDYATSAGLKLDFGIFPVYKSPPQDLFHKFGTSPKFEVVIDEEQVGKALLLSYQNSDFAGFKVTTRKEGGQEIFVANLYSHTNYIRHGRLVIDQITKLNEEEDQWYKSLNIGNAQMVAPSSDFLYNSVFIGYKLFQSPYEPDNYMIVLLNDKNETSYIGASKEIADTIMMAFGVDLTTKVQGSL